MSCACATANRWSFSFNYREVLKGDKPEQSITLEPGDTIVVP